MKLSLPKIIALMAALITGTLLLTSRGCNMTELATNQKTETPTQPGSAAGSSSSGPSEPGGSVGSSGDYEKPVVTEWDSHNLVVLGENFIPVGDAFSTPFATFYRIDEKGYIPVSPMGPVNTDGPCQKKWYPRDRPAGVGVIEDDMSSTTGTATQAAPDMAANGRALKGTRDIPPDCPRDLGSNLEPGSYVFDKDGTDLAGFDFKTNPHLYEIVDNHGKKYLVFPEGGKGPADDPAMKKMKLETLLVDASVYLKVHDHGEAMNEIHDLIPGSTGAEIKYFPAKSAGDNPQDAEDALVAAVQKEIEVLIKRLDEEDRAAKPALPDQILISVRTPNYSSEELAAQQRRIKAKLKKTLDEMKARINRQLILIHFGSELPACARALSACRAVNNSVAIYSGAR